MQGWLSPGWHQQRWHRCASADRLESRGARSLVAVPGLVELQQRRPGTGQGISPSLLRAAEPLCTELRRLCAFNPLVATFLSGPSQSLLPRHVGTSLLGLMMQHQVFSSVPAITIACSFRNVTAQIQGLSPVSRGRKGESQGSPKDSPCIWSPP